MNAINSKIIGERENTLKFSKKVIHIYIIMTFIDVCKTDTSVLLKEKEPFTSSCLQLGHSFRFSKPNFAFLSICIYLYIDVCTHLGYVVFVICSREWPFA